jgi:hypothetical protein
LKFRPRKKLHVHKWDTAEWLRYAIAIDNWAAGFVERSVEGEATLEEARLFRTLETHGHLNRNVSAGRVILKQSLERVVIGRNRKGFPTRGEM